MRSTAWIIARDAAVAAVGLSLLGVAVNAVRPGGIPLVATEEYEVFVPCPEPMGEVEGVPPGDPRLGDRRTLVVDARDPAAFAQWHLPGAWPIPFDYLEGVADEVVRRVASSGAAQVVVYGDGDDPDSGREMARELAGRGVRNVFYVMGGFRALKEDAR